MGERSRVSRRDSSVNEWEKVCPVSTHKFDYTELLLGQPTVVVLYNTRACLTGKCESVFDGATSRYYRLARHDRLLVCHIYADDEKRKQREGSDGEPTSGLTPSTEADAPQSQAVEHVRSVP